MEFRATLDSLSSKCPGRFLCCMLCDVLCPNFQGGPGMLCAPDVLYVLGVPCMHDHYSIYFIPATVLHSMALGVFHAFSVFNALLLITFILHVSCVYWKFSVFHIFHSWNAVHFGCSVCSV